MEFDEIKALLPQKFPFLMLDRVLELETGRSIVAIKNITGNEIVFLGHFPDMAVFPGVLVLECMAQAAILLFEKSADRVRSAGEQKLFLLGSLKARFLRPVVPGDQLRIEVSMMKGVSTGAVVDAVAKVDGEIAAKAELVFGVKQFAQHEPCRDESASPLPSCTT
jgi:3-hydroxyacyl-[acyl-carrier-protein] dehydratase